MFNWKHSLSRTDWHLMLEDHPDTQHRRIPGQLPLLDAIIYRLLAGFVFLFVCLVWFGLVLRIERSL